MKPFASDPTKPWYLLRDERGHLLPEAATQDAAYARGVRPEDVVRPEWPRADWCGRKRAHAPHTWGGEGWSSFRCAGRA